MLANIFDQTGTDLLNSLTRRITGKPAGRYHLRVEKGFKGVYIAGAHIALQSLTHHFDRTDTHHIQQARFRCPTPCTGSATAVHLSRQTMVHHQHALLLFRLFSNKSDEIGWILDGCGTTCWVVSVRHLLGVWYAGGEFPGF
jgi:hypothetical protein